MKPFREFIAELFDKPARWALTTEREDELKYESLVNGKILLAVFEEGATNQWTLSFTINGDLTTTGGGDEIPIFSTVLDMTADFIERIDPKSISFDAFKEVDGRDSRIKLYDRFIKRFASKYGYKLSSKNTVRDLYTDYVLVRKD